MEQKPKTYIRPIVIVMLFAFLTIGYAYLTSNLTINGASLLKKATWDVHFENVQVKDGSVTGEQVTQEPEIDSEQTTVSFHVNLKKPGDFYEFTVDAVNAGTIDAMINTYTEFDLTEDQLKYLETSVTYEDGEEIAEKQQLLAGDFAVYKIIVSFKKDLEADDLPSIADELDLEFTVEYVQKDETAIERRAETNSLYNILKRESDGGLVKKYVGEHQDSMDATKSTKNIYYFSPKTTSDNTLISNMVNVKFANHCWKILRTTDTGGVRLLYNGKVDDGQCLDSRSNHPGFYTMTSRRLYDNYWYSTDFTYDEVSDKYYLAGEIEQANWNSSNYSLLYGKYTCHSTNSTDGCDELYLIGEYNDEQNAYVLLFTDNYTPIPYSEIGKIQFSNHSTALSAAGYMYGDLYPLRSVKEMDSKSYGAKTTVYYSHSFTSDFLYSDSITYDGTNYVLTNPVSGSSLDNYSGYYTFKSSATSNSSGVYYVIGKQNNGSNYYYHILTNGKLINDSNRTIASSITKNGSYYELNNPITVSLSDWYNNYSSYKHYYICDDSISVTCENPKFFAYTLVNEYSLVPASTTLLIAKSRNGFQLNDTLVIRLDNLLMNSTEYGDYIYTCGSTENVCNASNLKRIVSFTTVGYKYAVYRFFGSSVTWNGSYYILNDPIEFEDVDNEDIISSHHYVCIDPGTQTCETVGYVFLFDLNKNSGYYGEIIYVIMHDGDTIINNVISKMITNNTNDSPIKEGIESWYKKTLLKYDNYIDDTIYCNNREIYRLGSWDPNTAFNSTLYFGAGVSQNPNANSLFCNNITDRFSVSNSLAKLNYKVGMISRSEESLSIPLVLKSGSLYWTMTPERGGSIGSYSTTVYKVSTDGYGGTNTSGGTLGVRPVISLKQGILFESGDGSKENPYHVKTEYDD